MAAFTRLNKEDYALYTEIPGLTELSGLAASYQHPGLFWAHNDSGHPATLFAFDENGTAAATINIDGAKSIDWEDIASYQQDQQNWIAVGDIGDNYALRSSISVYILREPENLSADRAEITQHYTLKYPTGARDAEGLAIDATAGYGYILSKRDVHPQLYRFTLVSDPQSKQTLELITEVKSLPTPEQHQPQKNGGITLYSPTALAFSADGSAALIVTLQYSYLFQRQENESWGQALNTTPRVLHPGAMPQKESGSFSVDGQSVLIGSEGFPAPLARIELANPK